MSDIDQSWTITTAEEARMVARRAFIACHHDYEPLFDVVWNHLARHPEAVLSQPVEGSSVEMFAAPGGDQRIPDAVAQDLLAFVETFARTFPFFREKLEERLDVSFRKCDVSSERTSTIRKSIEKEWARGRPMTVIVATKVGDPKVAAMDLPETEARQRWMNKQPDYNVFVWDTAVWLEDPAEHGKYVQVTFRADTYLHRLLVVLLRHRGKPLPPRWLFSVTHRAASDEAISPAGEPYGRQLQYNMRDLLKKLRRWHLEIRRKPMENYVCSGEFTFCLAIPFGMEDDLTLPASVPESSTRS